MQFPHNQTQHTSESQLELVIYLFKLLKYDFDRYSTKWTYVRLTDVLREPHTTVSDTLLKYFAIRILTLVLPEAVRSKELATSDAIYRRYFDQKELDQLAKM